MQDVDHCGERLQCEQGLFAEVEGRNEEKQREPLPKLILWSSQPEPVFAAALVLPFVQGLWLALVVELTVLQEFPVILQSPVQAIALVRPLT